MANWKALCDWKHMSLTAPIQQIFIGIVGLCNEIKFSNVVVVLTITKKYRDRNDQKTDFKYFLKILQ